MPVVSARMRRSSSADGYSITTLNMNRSSCASGSGYVPSCSIGFCVASTNSGRSRSKRTPFTVTWYSCIASSSAAWVFGGVRLISSARMMFAKIGPRMNRMTRLPVARSSSMTSAPRMSEGIRSGVNWMRLNRRSTASASFLMMSVFARPGTPRSRQCPPARNAIRISRITRCWPTIALASSRSSRPATSATRSSAGGSALRRSVTCRLRSGIGGSVPRPDPARRRLVAIDQIRASRHDSAPP